MYFPDLQPLGTHFLPILTNRRREKGITGDLGVEGQNMTVVCVFSVLKPYGR